MTIPQVPVGSIIGMIFSLILCIGVPVLACLFLRKKCHAEISGLLMGALTFIVATMVLEQMLHTVVFMAAGEIINNNIWLYALYGAAAAAVFEECARYFVMKRFLQRRNQLTRENALMYGVGHGGIEAILVTGFAYVNNIITSYLINSGGITANLEALDEANRALALQSLEVLGNTDSLMFYLGGIERVLAFALQIALSVLVYRAAKLGQRQYLILALAIHFGVNFITVLLAQYLPVAAAELILLVMVAGAAWFAYRLYHQAEEGAGI